MTKQDSSTTIIDIAKRANVTDITVSRAFNHPEMVKKETRDKILAIAQELNYVPNLFARNLKNKNSRIIGVVTDSTFNPFYVVLIQTVSRLAKEKGYQVMIFDSDSDEKAEKTAIETLVSYKASGILLSPVRDDKDYQPSYLSLIDQHNVPLVFVDRAIYGYEKKYSGLFLKNFEIGALTGKFLNEQNSENTLIISGPKNSEISLSRLSGIYASFPNRKNLNVLYSSYMFNKKDEAYLRQKVQELYTPGMYIVGLNGIITAGMYKIIAELGLSCRYFSVDLPPYADTYHLSISGVHHDSVYLGELTTELLFTEIERDTNKGHETKQIFVDGKLVIY
ncbi:LacI family DNA-binding transcriptional regulator [Providencia vermicola]|uniref:LacI family DNA-binding transcriptional regulator n=1 Tax=Providencia vermicola TaxID=333965 RepID=UPI001CEC80D2|nr:LacI family DNA-binding transcriptional regulator [Providencia vermicola]